MRAGAYEELIAIKLISLLKRHSSCDSSRDSFFLMGGVSAAESRRPSSGGHSDGIGADERDIHIYIVKVLI
jgi:hypothetical protein